MIGFYSFSFFSAMVIVYICLIHGTHPLIHFLSLRHYFSSSLPRMTPLSYSHHKPHASAASSSSSVDFVSGYTPVVSRSACLKCKVYI